MIKLTCNGVDISELFTKITWSGDKKQAARKIEFGVAVSPRDYYLPTTKIMMGDYVEFYKSEQLLFQGHIFFKEKSIKGNEMQVTAYDRLIYLLKSSGTYNFKGATPQAITTSVCKDFDIAIGSLESGSPLNRIFDNETIYNIIMTAYTLESNKSGKQFIPLMKNNKLQVIEKGKIITDYKLDSRSNILDATYSESMENSVNKVKMYDEKGNYKGEVTIDGVPGTIQKVYKAGKDDDIQKEARALLQGVEHSASVEALGNIECITGNAIKMREPYTGINGLFYIDSDEHIFDKKVHTMKLGISYQNMMDSQEGGQAEENKDKEGGE